jgi:hypothetical protein
MVTMSRTDADVEPNGEAAHSKPYGVHERARRRLHRELLHGVFERRNHFFEIGQQLDSPLDTWPK